MNHISTYFICILIAAGLPDIVCAQSSQIEKANEFYRTGQYTKAITFYEEALDIKENNAVSSKLAYCYRMINRQDKAAPLYAAVIASGKAKADDYYYYGESLMSAGKYAEAKQHFQKFLELEPNDERAPLLIANCDRAPLIQDLFHEVYTLPFSQNSEVDDNAPVIWQGGIIFASDRKLGFRLLKEKSDWTGRDYINLYYAPATAENVFAEADLYSAKINDLNKNTGNASFTADGSMVFFSRNSDELSRNNSYNLQLFSAESAGQGKWKAPKALPFCSPEWNYMHPAIAPDGKTLFFVTDKRDGQGGTDLYMSVLSKKGWSNAVNLGPVINTPANEGFPFFSTDGKLYFCSKGHPGFGGFDIFCATQVPNGEWGQPVNIGRPFNSTYDDISIFINPENNAGLFTSSRDGGDDDIYLFKIGVPFAQPENVVAAPAESEVQQAGDARTEMESIPELVVEQAPETAETTEMAPEKAPALAEPDKSKRKTDKKPVVIKHELKLEPANPESPAGSHSDSNMKMPSAQITIPVGTVENTLPAQQTNQEKPLPPTQHSSQSSKPAEQHPVRKLLSDTINDVMTPPSGKGNTLDDLAWFLKYKQPITGKTFIVEGIYYPQDQIAVTPAIALQLDKVADLLMRHSSLKVEMGVHTESVGDDSKNLQNSLFRSEIIVEYLVFKGIDPKRLSYKGYGETQPLNQCINGVNCNPDEYRVNNRVEMKIL